VQVRRDGAAAGLGESRRVAARRATRSAAAADRGGGILHLQPGVPRAPPRRLNVGPLAEREIDAEGEVGLS
jgi:hypothetical protein